MEKPLKDSIPALTELGNTIEDQINPIINPIIENVNDIITSK